MWGYSGAARGKAQPSEEVKVTKADDLRRDIEEAIARAAAGKRRKLDDSVKASPAQPPKRVERNPRRSSDDRV
jgi:hypothetical protein